MSRQGYGRVRVQWRYTQALSDDKRGCISGRTCYAEGEVTACVGGGTKEVSEACLFPEVRAKLLFPSTYNTGSWTGWWLVSLT